MSRSQGPDGERKEKRRVFPFLKGSRMGRMRCMKLLGEDFSGLTYAVLSDGKEMPDTFGRSFTGHGTWGELSHVDTPLRSRFELESFDWEGDRPLQLPYEI